MTSLLRSLFPASRIRLPATARYLATTAETSTAADPSPVAESSTSPSEPAKFTPYTRRAGLLARKRGMTALWDQDGRRWPVTVLQVQECQVIQHRTPHETSPHLHGLQIGAKNKHWSKETVFMQGHYRTKGEGVQPKYRLKEFQVTEDAVMKVGSWLSAGHFVPGQYVDVRAKTIGKGFQGVMKRFGWRGQSATHGTTKTHRSPGAIGANQDPGKVWKGRKMAGRMGGKFRTTQNLLVHRIDLALNLIYVRGHVPGVDDQYIEVSDAVRKVKWKAEASFMAGKDSDEWLDEGVSGLPMPGLTLEDVKSGEWPEVVEWPGTGKPLTS